MSRRCAAPLVLMLALVLAGSAGARETIREFDDPAQRQRYYALLEEIRCLVCQNESLASSSADLAQDLRAEVYRLVVTEDRSNDAAVEFLVQRYGDFVLYRPPVRPTTWLLWGGPFLLLAVGGAVLAAVVRRRRAQPERELSAAEHERARRLLDTNGHGDDS